jgi:anaerobic carbon-monoxide dehydrogenase iron sulfur subunit
MKTVVVRPERCVGCRQCSLACAVAHSPAQTLAAALLLQPPPVARIHLGAGQAGEPFPNRCRHCDPAPCQLACITGAIRRLAASESLLIDGERCIRCAACAMACPFGAIRFQPDVLRYPPRWVAIKCDNCSARQEQGLIPACVEACKVGALLFAELDEVMRNKTTEVARRAVVGIHHHSEDQPDVRQQWLLLRAQMAAL